MRKKSEQLSYADRKPIMLSVMVWWLQKWCIKFDSIRYERMLTTKYPRVVLSRECWNQTGLIQTKDWEGHLWRHQVWLHQFLLTFVHEIIRKLVLKKSLILSNCEINHAFSLFKPRLLWVFQSQTATRGFFAVNNVCTFTSKNDALSELTQLI